eukprot:6139115-Prymnesium_polylepis.1
MPTSRGGGLLPSPNPPFACHHTSHGTHAAPRAWHHHQGSSPHSSDITVHTDTHAIGRDQFIAKEVTLARSRHHSGSLRE